MRFFSDLMRFFWNIQRANEIRKDPERRPKSVRFGVLSIICSILAVALSLLLFFLPWMLNGDGMIFLLFGIALVAVGAIGAVIMLIHAITDFFLQLSLNKRAVTWIALVFLVASVAACVVVVCSALGKIN